MGYHYTVVTVTSRAFKGTIDPGSIAQCINDAVADGWEFVELAFEPTPGGGKPNAHIVLRRS